MKQPGLLWIGIAIAVVSAACGDVVDNPDRRQPVLEMPAKPNRDLDLLFVVDDSPSMLDKQIAFTNGFPAFIERLNAVPGGLPNLHIGVITTDMGTKASGSDTPGPAIGQIGNGGCSGTGKGGALQIGSATLNDRFLIDVEAPGGGRTRNYSGELASVFSAMARQGAGGCGFEQPLAAMRAALSNHPANAGFLRPEAMLGVIFLGDEDDCSAKSTTLFSATDMTLGPLQSFRCTRFGVTCATSGQTPDEMNQVGTKSGCGSNASSTIVDDVAPYRDFLLGLESAQRKVVVSGILGPAEPVAVELRAPPGGGAPIPVVSASCTYATPTGMGGADPGVRLKAFLDGFQDRSTVAPICQPDLSGGLGQIAEAFRRSIGSPCVEAVLADVDPDAAGLQVDCAVEDVVGGVATAIVPCDATASARPCWRLESDAASCGSAPPPSFKLIVQRDTPPDPAAITRMRCLVAP